MSAQQHADKRRPLWQPKRMSTRLSTSQAAHQYDKRRNGYTCDGLSSKTVELSPETVIVHLPGVRSARRSYGSGDNDTPRVELPSSHPLLSAVSQTTRDDLHTEGRPSSDEDDPRTNGTSCVGHGSHQHPAAVGGPNWSSGHYSRLAQEGPVCTTPGLCQAGGELRLTHLNGKAVQVLEGFELVGAKSPRMPGMTLVAAVDKRFLPDKKNNVTMLGFSGNCIGCGAKGFRYFTEFSYHINLKLGTQPKKQKHLKYYITREASGRICKGPSIPWRVEAGRKRTFPQSGPFIPPPYTVTDTEVLGETSETRTKSALTPSHFTPHCASESPGDGDIHVPLSHLSNQNTLEPTLHQVPPVKRRRWQSEDSDTLTSADDSHPSDTHSAPQTFATASCDAGELPPDLWLTTACSVRPVMLLCHHAIPKIPCSVEDIIISDLLVGCFDPPLVSDHHNQFGSMTGVYSKRDHLSAASTECPGQVGRSHYSGVPCLTTQMAVLLTVQYLAQFVDDDRICREDVESLLQDARLELTASVQHQAHLLAQSNAVTHVQLPVLASLTAATSKGRVKVVCSPVSLDNAILRALKFILEIHRHNQSKFPKVPVPDFIFILATSQKKAPEFCLLVTSASQAKYLSEAMVGHPVGPRITDNLSKLEQLFRLSSDALEQLIASYEAMGQGQLMFFPFNGFARMKVMADEAVRLEPRAINAAYQHHDGSAHVLFASQLLMAKQLLAQVCSISENVNSLDLNSFIAVDLAIIVPPLSTLYNQTVKRLWKSRLLSDLELESADGAASFHSATKYVIKHNGNDETREQLLKLLEKVQKQPKVLFVIILDQAQFYTSPQGAVDLPYYKEFQEARNVLMLFVTAVPYLFQTNCSFIDPNNEVYWSDVRSETDGGSLVSLESSQDNPETNEGTYFGMKEYCESIKWTHQFPLVRQDDAFEKMALRTSRTTDDVNLSVLRCYLLIRHYCAAIMWSAGIKPAEPHCTLKTIQIMREVIESPVHNADGSGAMLVIRIPCVELANVAFESLKNTRDRLGFQFRFAIIHNSGASELEIEEYFLRRLRLWKEQRGTKEQRGRNQGKCFASWSPKCFEDLHDLPCIIIMSGRERPGDTFPRSLKYIDLRLIDRGFVYRSSLELEFSAIACYIGAGTGSRSVEGSEANAQQPVENKDSSNASGAGGTTCKTSHYSSNYPLPVILVSRSVFKAFQSDFYGYPKHLLLPTTSQTRWAGLGRPPVVTSNPRHQSLYYREWTEPKPKQFLGPQYNPAQSVITTRSASGVVISPDITDVVEEDGMSAVESLAGSNKLTSGAGTSDGEDSSNEDTKPCTENGAASKRGTGDQNTPAVNSRQEHQSVIGPTLLRRLSSMTAYSKPTADGEATSIDSATDNIDINPDLYHPRSILFSGPPQVGKTLAYLHFVRLLHRTVQKLQCVDVYNENLCSSVENLSQTKPEVSGKEEEKIAWPVHATVSKLPFNCALREHRYTNISKLRAHSSTGSAKSEQDVTHKLSIKGSNDRPTCSLMLSSWVAYDYYHHCDSCKHYREGMGASTSLWHVFTLGSGDKLQFVIPPTCQQNFTFTEDKRLRSLQLPLVLTGGPGEIVRLLKTEPGDKEATRAVKSAILVPSCGRHESGLLNLYHAMEGENHMLLVFVKNQEIALYHKTWPNHVIVGLPQSCDLQGLGAARYFIKQFATENWLAERERHGVNGKHGQDVWPFVFMMDDSCVLWQNLLKQTIKGESSPSKEPEGPFCVNTSLLKILQHLESTPDLMNYGMIGVRQYSSNISTPVWQGSFSHCPLHTAVMMNLRVLQHVHYDKQRYSREDLDFSVRVFANGILSCRFNHLVVAKKVIATGGHTAYKVQATRSSEESGRVELGEKLVTAPDREDAPYLSVPAYYLLERYLAQVGAVKLFPEAADKPDRPVLVLNCYVNLGPRICLEFASTSGGERGRKAVKQQVDRQDTRYGGLLLYFCDRSVSADFLAQFQFVPGSRLCLVCQDRNTLRQEVVRLDLEEHWRFRLRDEFQTANCPDEPALYFLTGTYE